MVAIDFRLRFKIGEIQCASCSCLSVEHNRGKSLCQCPEASGGRIQEQSQGYRHALEAFLPIFPHTQTYLNR